MENANTNPFLVALFFIVRCLVPLLIMLGVSYLLKRFGLIALASQNHRQTRIMAITTAIINSTPITVKEVLRMSKTRLLRATGLILAGGLALISALALCRFIDQPGTG